MTIAFLGRVIFWKGPAPFFFVAVPEDLSREIKAIEKVVSYGWGCIPVTVRLGETEWQTSLMPKDGVYLVPVRAVFRKAHGLEEGQDVSLRIVIGDGGSID